MRRTLPLSLLFALLLSAASAQQFPTPTITVQSNLVEVPALVTTKKGEVIFALKASDFRLTDDGIPQHISLVSDTDWQPLAMAIVVETGGDGAARLGDYQGLDAILDSVVGAEEHLVALITFDSAPHLVVPFTSNTDYISAALDNLRPGDQGASILDAVAFAVRLLDNQPPGYRREVLLISETIDQGSFTTPTEALRLLSDTNTTMYTFAFSSSRSAVGHEAAKFNDAEAGPAHGCFSRNYEGDPTDAAEYKDHYPRQVLDCISQLAPPLRLATMAFLAAHDAIRHDTARTIAHLAGGEFFHFGNTRSLQRDLIQVSHDVPNFYVFSFRPTDPAPGLHALHLSLVDRPQLRLTARTEYWIDKSQ
jgi:VWFA-related protein